MAEAITGHDFIDRLLEQAPPAASQPRRGQNYNFPERLYLKPDGMVVSLQADPQNRAYYQDKGYHMLSDTPGRGGAQSEVEQYVQAEYPAVLKEQRDKAAIINAIRRFGERHRDYTVQDTFDDYSLEELRDYLKVIKEDTGKDIRVILPKRAQAREDARDAALLRGVETSASASMEEVHGKLEASRTRRPA